MAIPMNIRLLNSFVAVYEERHITLAAEKCFVTQPSISSNLKLLEERLGYKLFERVSKGVVPTPAADKLYPKALKLIDDLNGLSSVETTEKQTLKIGLPLDFSPEKNKQLLTLIYEEFPDLTIHLRDWREANDVRFTLDINKKDSEVFIPLWEETYYLCLPNGHPLTQYDTVPLSALDNEIFMECPTCDSHAQMAKLKTGSRRTITIGARADTKMQVMQLVEAGFGISFLPEGLLEKSNDIVYRKIEGPRIFRRIGLAIEANKIEEEVTLRLMDALTSYDFN
ncbi:LysR family transcriptional regulator [Vibrio sp. FNV 38]|nr:LysR family transcriptional regulator [Vibrio sp. FNV 38]